MVFDGLQPDGHRHHASGDALGNSHDILGGAPADGHDITDDWLDCSDDFVAWLLSLDESSTEMGPATMTPPQSPTAVDRILPKCTISPKQERERKPRIAIEFELNASADSSAGSSDDEDLVQVKSDPFADAGKLRALLEGWIKQEALLKEVQRLRQRGYEKTYRKRKQVGLHTTRLEWIELETRLRKRLQRQSHPYRLARNATLHDRYVKELEEARALQQDILLMKTMSFWKRLFALRNYTITEDEVVNGIPEDEEEDVSKIPEEILSTAEQWASIEYKILGASTTKHFQPLHFEFEW